MAFNNYKCHSVAHHYRFSGRWKMNLVSSRITQKEQNAKAKHLSAVQHIGSEAPPDEFNDFLEQHILPLLVRTGFDREIAGNIFRISAPAWKSLRRSSEPQLFLYPGLARDISTIRRDIVSRDGEVRRQSTSSKKNSQRELHGIADNQLSLEALSEMLQAIPTPWIILPRAYSFLTNGDSRCLVVYLQHLDRETNLAFKKILARILIEYIGNYSLKFISSNLPKKHVMEAVFYGYAAMFWKNLQKPPPDLEDLLLFRNYLSWAKAFVKRPSGKDIEKKAVTAEMEEMASAILPDHTSRTQKYGKDHDVSGLHITLRHGRPGIDHAVRYFKINRALLFDNNHDHQPYREMTRKISSLFRVL
ncbi:MAG TPA: hypothetical protein ENO10_02300, partial [Salinimicrobium catena]|nr:hypothetical protein [Salinimicrobium catena]